MKDDLKSFVEYVVTGFENKHLVVSCARAFRDLCVDNATVLSQFS